VAFFSKESGLALLALVVLYDLVFRAGGTRRQIVRPEYLVLAAVAGAYLVARSVVARAGLPPDDVSPIDNPIVEAGFLAGRLTAIGVMGRALGLLVWPWTLSADYSFAQIPVVAFPPDAWGDWGAILALVAIVALVIAAWRLRRVAPVGTFFVLFTLAALLPSANLILVIGSIMADRFLYLPLVGFAGATALAAERLATTHRTSVGVSALLILFLLGARTAARNRDWRDEVALWESAVTASPESAKAHKAHAAALFAADPQHRVLERVIAEAERAVAIRPDYLLALIDLGGYYIVRGDVSAAGGGEAAGWYAKAVEVLERGRVLDDQVNRRFAEKLVATGRESRGIAQLGNIELHQNLGLAHLRLGRFADALAAYERTRELEPTDPSRYVDVSAVLCHLGRWEEAAIALFQAVTVRPEDRDAPMRLVEVYRTFDPDGHETVSDGPDRVTVALDSPVVHRHRCAAFAGLQQIFTRANQPRAAEAARGMWERDCSGEE
jgi:tetratricopeptide (TPR) repeat protein